MADRNIILVGDGSFSCISLAHTCIQLGKVTLTSRLRFWAKKSIQTQATVSLYKIRWGELPLEGSGVNKDLYKIARIGDNILMTIGGMV